jgi:DNA-binding CsgD family transcriptional regulator
MAAIHGLSGRIDGSGTMGCSGAADSVTNEDVVAADTSAISRDNPISARFIAVAARATEVDEDGPVFRSVLELRTTELDDALVLVSIGLENDPVEYLSLAEQEVCRHAVAGLSNAAIAELRGCSPRTIANQLAAVYRKLGVRGRRELRVHLSRGGGR